MSGPSRPHVEIGRLTLSVPGLAAGEAGRLAQEVASQLARQAGGGDLDLPRLVVTLGPDDTTVERIAAAIARAIRAASQRGS